MSEVDVLLSFNTQKCPKICIYGYWYKWFVVASFALMVPEGKVSCFWAVQAGRHWGIYFWKLLSFLCSIYLFIVIQDCIQCWFLKRATRMSAHFTSWCFSLIHDITFLVYCFCCWLRWERNNRSVRCVRSRVATHRCWRNAWSSHFSVSTFHSRVR